MLKISFQEAETQQPHKPDTKQNFCIKIHEITHLNSKFNVQINQNTIFMKRNNYIQKSKSLKMIIKSSNKSISSCKKSSKLEYSVIVQFSYWWDLIE